MPLLDPTVTLSSRQEAFCRHFVASGNAADAARQAGYSERSARQTGCALLERPWPGFLPNVTACVASRRSIRKERAEERSGATVEVRDAAGGRLDATRRAALSGRHGASIRLPDAPHRAARLSYPAGPTAPRRP